MPPYSTITVPSGDRILGVREDSEYMGWLAHLRLVLHHEEAPT